MQTRSGPAARGRKVSRPFCRRSVHLIYSYVTIMWQEANLFFLVSLFFYLFLARARSLSLRRPFSGRGEPGLLSPCGAWASPCRGSFGCGPRALGRGLQWLQSSNPCLLRWQTDSLPHATREAPVSDSFRSVPVGREACLLQRAVPPGPPPLWVLGAHPCRLLSQISEFACFCYSQPSGGM